MQSGEGGALWQWSTEYAPAKVKAHTSNPAQYKREKAFVLHAPDQLIIFSVRLFLSKIAAVRYVFLL